MSGNCKRKKKVIKIKYPQIIFPHNFDIKFLLTFVYLFHSIAGIAKNDDYALYYMKKRILNLSLYIFTSKKEQFSDIVCCFFLNFVQKNRYIFLLNFEK